MKKLISLLLVVIFICSALVGCDWGSIFNQNENANEIISITTTTTTTTTTTATPLFPENPTIEHGGHFTQDDIDFVLMLHGETRNDRAEKLMLPHYWLSEVLTMAKNGYPLFLANFENPYLICAYLKTDATEYELDEFGDYKFDATKYVWYKFYDYTQIPEQMGEMKVTDDIYLLHDCIIVKDIVNDIEYNKHGKYYIRYENDSDWEKTTPTMLLYYDYPSWVIGESKFIPYPKYGGADFEIYVDEQGNQYLYFLYESCCQDGTGYLNYAIKLFGEHYDALSSDFEVLKEYIGYNERLTKDAGIKLDVLIKYLTNEE